jgi:tetratricopeptide (TPR) repeat protein
MSLLMDALKQAEHDKHDQPAEPADIHKEVVSAAARAPDMELTLTPAEQDMRPESDAEARSGSDTVNEMPAVENTEPAEPMEAQGAPVSAASTGSPTDSRAASRILAASEARRTAQRRRAMLGMIGLGAVLTFSIAGYYYYAQLAQPQNQMSLPRISQAEVIAPLDVRAAAESESVEILSVADEFVPTAAADESRPRQETVPHEVHSTSHEHPAQVQDAGVLPVAAPAIQISRNSRPDKLNSGLLSAYENFKAGRWALAEQGYREILAREPDNRDAKLGLAALAETSGDLDAARVYYRDVLRRDPRDAVAFSALAELETARGSDSESELKLRLREQPRSAQLHFALGNLYAAQLRWPLAQQAYFEAHRLASDHPEYAFNLAVSLEHIGQPQLALNYYRRALVLAEAGGGVFDLLTIHQRISALTRVSGS